MRTEALASDYAAGSLGGARAVAFARGTPVPKPGRAAFAGVADAVVLG